MDTTTTSAARSRRATQLDVLLVANARASGVRDRGRAQQALSALRARGARADLRMTGDVDELADAIDDRERRVVLLGGDGSVHAFANLPEPLPELALLPAGRANNVARSLGIPLDVGEAAALAVEGPARPLDVIDVRSGARRYRAVEGVSVGFHAQARVRYHADNSAAIAHGLAVGLQTLWKFRPLSVVVESDGVEQEMTVGQLFAANLPLYGFGLRVAPGADPSDGELDLVTIEADTRRSVVAMLPRLRSGTHYGLDGVRVRRARRVRVDARRLSPVVADSTDLGSDAAELTVVGSALEVVSP